MPKAEHLLEPLDENGLRPDCSDIKERRGFFRIDDDVLLTYQPISEESWANLENRTSNSRVNSFNLRAQFAALDQAIRPVRSRLRQHSEDLATCLEVMDSKLEMLAEVLFQADGSMDELPSREVNLSAGGISFHVQKPLEMNGILHLRLLLLPSRIGIETHGRVVYCRKVKEYEVGQFPWKVGVEFQEMRPEDMDLIIRHVLCKQADERRRRQGSAPSERS